VFIVKLIPNIDLKMFAETYGDIQLCAKIWPDEYILTTDLS
jgi:hypothetical protein